MRSRFVASGALDADTWPEPYDKAEVVDSLKAVYYLLRQRAQKNLTGRAGRQVLKRS